MAQKIVRKRFCEIFPIGKLNLKNLRIFRIIFFRIERISNWKLSNLSNFFCLFESIKSSIFESNRTNSNLTPPLGSTVKEPVSLACQNVGKIPLQGIRLLQFFLLYVNVCKKILEWNCVLHTLSQCYECLSQISNTWSVSQ